MSARGVTKGKEYERRTARILRRVYSDARRCTQYHERHNEPDVQAGPLRVEVKSYRCATASVYVRTWKAHRGAGRVPMVVQSTGRATPILATLALDDLVRLLRRGAR